MGKKESEVGLVLFVALIIVLGLINKSWVSAPSTDDNQIVNETNTTNNNAQIPIASLNYSQALDRYKNARMQFGPNCKASPAKITLKNGAYLMIDNRAAVARTFQVGSTFSVKAYGFKILKLSSEKSPVTWYVDCDTSQNVATIFIQK